MPKRALESARMHLVQVGLDHHHAPIWLRERTAFAAGQAASRHVLERAEVREALVLSTCNRVELYATAERDRMDEVAERLVALLAERAEAPVDAVRAHLVVRRGTEAVRHLCRVAAGLESMAVGETQIAGQLRRAVAAARAEGALGRVLQRASCIAMAAGKRARGEAPAVRASMGVSAVRALGGVQSLAGAVIVVLGAGETADDVLRAFASAKAKRVTIVNRTLERAAALAAIHDAEAAPWVAREELLADADVVFACTAAAEPVLDVPLVEELPRRARRIVDLGVPRNVAPEVRAVEGVTLLDVDDLAPWSEQPCAAPAVEGGAIDFWVERFERWLANQAAVPTIADLRANAEKIRQREVRRALAKLPTLSAEERAAVEHLATRLVNQLLHDPLSTLSAEPDAAALAESARRLFRLPALPR